MNLLNQNRKSHVEFGNIYFWTATINKWQRLLQNDSYKEIIISSLEFLSHKGKIDVFAFVIMPNHIHVIWRINELNGKEKPNGSFLKFTAHEFKKMLIEEGGNLKNYYINAVNKKYEFWQRDPLATHLYTQHVAYQKLNYIHYNPCQEGWKLVDDPCDYKYSTAGYYERGIKTFSFIKDLREEF